MCGVVGYNSDNPQPEDIESICRIFDESKIRGLHSFGFTALKDGLLIVGKYNDMEMLKREIRKIYPFNAMIGHTRYSTSGDYKDPLNNQPINLNEASLVFNGVITMKTKAEYEKEFGRKYHTENDGEIVLKKYIDKEDFKDFVMRGKFSFAGIILSKQEMVIFKNANRPLWGARINGSLFVASTSDILKRSSIPTKETFRFGETECLSL